MSEATVVMVTVHGSRCQDSLPCRAAIYE